MSCPNIETLPIYSILNYYYTISAYMNMHTSTPRSLHTVYQQNNAHMKSVCGVIEWVSEWVHVSIETTELIVLSLSTAHK